jgi:uncharacterized protein (TIGR03118 family)
MRFPLLFCAVLHGLAVAGTFYNQLNLVSDIPGLARVTDPNLKNPWGMSFAGTSPFWVSDAGTSVSTLYDGVGNINALVVSMPPTAPVPTGQVSNPTTGFEVTPGNPARFIFAGITGTISGWNPTSDATHAILKVSSTNATYTGLALATNASGTFLYAANFKSGHIDVYNSNYSPVTLGGSFTDPTLPSGYAPFNVESVAGNLYVQYAKVGSTGEDEPGPGNGFVSVFDTNGNFIRRLISRGPLNSPWGITLAPSVFGDFSNDLLIGNFGDGVINVFDPITGAFLDSLRDKSGNPLVNDGLWALKVRTGGTNVNPNAVYFTAGINDEAHGLFGAITVVPEPGTALTIAFGLLAAIGLHRRMVR